MYRSLVSVSVFAVGISVLAGCELLDEPDTGDEPVGECTQPGGFTFCDPDDLTRVYGEDACGNVLTVTSCSPTTACDIYSVTGEAYCACPLTEQTTCSFGNDSGLYEPSSVVLARECNNIVDEPNDVVQDCDWGSICYQDDDGVFLDGEAECRRSIDESVSDSPYYDFGCSFEDFLEFPTGLDIDCRCRIVGDSQGGGGGSGSALADPNNTDVDDGARPGGPVANCVPPGEMVRREWPIDYGEGPSFNAWYQQNNSGAVWYGGVVDEDTREMFAIVRWSDPLYQRSGAVVAWDLDTGDRRVVSGLHPDPQTGLTEYGSGYLSPAANGLQPPQMTEAPLTGANVLRWGPDGMLYVAGGGLGEVPDAQRNIVRVDPNSGERTLVWQAQNQHSPTAGDTFGQCFRPEAVASSADVSIAMSAYAFEVGPDGEFYFAFRDTRAGDGIVEISADGSTCTPLARWGGDGHAPGGNTPSVAPPTPIGGGFSPQFPVEGLLFHDGLVYGSANDEMYAFNLVTGDRTSATFSTNRYEGMGVSNMFWDDTRDVIWAVGAIGTYIGAIVDPVTGRVESIYADTGMVDYGNEAILVSDYGVPRTIQEGGMLQNGHYVGYGGFVLDPDDPNIAFVVTGFGGLVKYELSTFNNYMFSW